MKASALAVFRTPTPMKITGRSSSITNAFVNGIIPVLMPMEEEVVEALQTLGLSADDVRCAYCGDRATEWDHLRPIVKGQRPTGYISEIANLVPACGKCNQSKSGSDWRPWMLGTARLCPTVRKIQDIEMRIARLEAFERWREPRRIDFEAAAGPQLWAEYWQDHDRLLALMRECEGTASRVRLTVKAAVPRRGGAVPG